MRNLFFLMFVLSLVFLSCKKEDDPAGSQNCPFIGKWCTEDPISPGQCSQLGGITLEFRSNGELLQLGTTAFTWKSSDCKTIELYHKASGQKAQEYKVISISGNRMRIDVGTEAELIRSN